jgi:hypothetical protein
MTKPKIFNCPICGNNFIYTTKFLEHVQETHHLSILDQEQFYIEYFLNGVEPLCACGCGKRTKFYKLNYGFPLRFIRGHNASEQGNWKNPEIMQKAVAKRVQGFKEQKYVVWNKGLTQETNEIVAHISKQGHETLKRKYASGELISWQKGLTIDDPRIKQAVETRRANGFVPWNLGLTKETDSRLMSIAQKNSQMYDLPDAGRRTKLDEIRKRINSQDKFSIDEKDITLYKHKATRFPCKCNKCGDVQYKTISMLISRSRCYSCDPQGSVAQQEIYSFVKLLGFDDVLYCDRKAINPKELDVYIPSRKFAIEYNGLYWHSDIKFKNELGHQEKLDLCCSNDIKLLTIYEDEWLQNKEFVKNLIKDQLGLVEKTQEKEFYIRQLDVIEYDNFVTQNSFGNKKNANMIVGIFSSNDKLYATMSINEIIYFGKQCYEIVQLLMTFDCHKDLIKELLFECVLQANENHKDGVLILSDTRFIDDKFYLSFGFSIVESKCQLWSTDFINRYEITSENDLEESSGVAIIYGTKNNIFFLPCVQRDSSVL